MGNENGDGKLAHLFVSLLVLDVLEITPADQGSSGVESYVDTYDQIVIGWLFPENLHYLATKKFNWLWCKT